MDKILVVGQTPPPFGGQAVMIEKILKGHYNNLELYHAPMKFSSDMDHIGRVQISKIARLPLLIAIIIFYRLRYRTPILYYPPAGPQRVPMYRDFIILIATRWLFSKTIFHFHAGGISTLYHHLSFLEKVLFRLAYFNPDLAIHPSALNPPDGQFVRAKKSIVIPHGLEDNYLQASDYPERIKPEPVLLFVGVLQESKGVLVLLEAAKIIHERGISFQLNMMGQFISSDFRQTLERYIAEHCIENRVCFLGVQTGVQKWARFAEADIFCFPTFFESESFGLVVLEAMQFELPVVATRWRGVPDLVQDGITGFLIPPQDALTLADRLELLLGDPSLARKMGQAGRQVYLSKFHLQKFYTNIEDAILDMCRNAKH